jgi:hypothetical protein
MSALSSKISAVSIRIAAMQNWLLRNDYPDRHANAVLDFTGRYGELSICNIELALAVRNKLPCGYVGPVTAAFGRCRGNGRSPLLLRC